MNNQKVIRCEICNRYPAKKMTFKGHQGFLVARRELKLEGVYCRDHAIEAYAAIQKKNLKGMWFSPTSLVFGAARALIDSAKMLDLPPEPKDEPWVQHKVNCPHCGSDLFSFSGLVECDKCKNAFSILSCPKCETAVVDFDDKEIEKKRLECKTCGYVAKAPEPILNWPKMLLAFAFTEVACGISMADGSISEEEKTEYESKLENYFKFAKSTVSYLKKYFIRCSVNKSEVYFYKAVQNCSREFLQLLVSLGKSIAEVDGEINEKELEFLKKLSLTLGFDPSHLFGTSGHSNRDDKQNWEKLFQLDRNCSMEQLRSAYKKLVAQYHPDLWCNAPVEIRNVAEERMKIINIAYSEAKKAIQIDD